MMRKRKIIGIGLLIVTLLGTTGCAIDTGDGSSKKEGGDTAGEKKDTLTIMMSAGDGGSAALKDVLGKAADIMNIELEYSTFPDDQFLNVVNTKGATQNLDDIIFTAANLPDIPYQEFAPLEGEWIEKVSDTTAPFIVNPDDGNDDVLLAPIGAESNYGLIYNKKVLEDADVELPILNYDGFLEACEKIKATGVTPVYVSNKESWTAQILLQASFTGILENKEGLVDGLATNTIKPQEVPEIVKLWDNVAKLKDKGYVNEDCLSATHEMAKEVISNGDAAFYAATDSVYGEIMNEFPELVGDVGMTICPMWDDEKDAFIAKSTSCKRIAVNKNSEKIELAKEFINTCMSEPVLKAYYEALPGLAPFKDLRYELSMSPWNEEMQMMEGTIPVKADWGNQPYDGELKFGEFWGDFTLRGQSLFAGVSAEEALTQWYEAYAESAKAKRLEGF